MKAIILERRGDYAAALCEDGTIVKTRVSGAVGETVELAAETVAFQVKKTRRWMRSAVAAALALAVTGGALGYMGTTASAYVSLDVEDSAIELTVNHFGRVIAVRAVSDDAQALAENLDAELRHRPAAEAIGHAMDRLRDEGYLSGADDTVIAGVASDDDRRAAALAQSVEAAVGGAHPLFVSEGSRAEREQALSQRQSVGRFFYERRDPDDWNEERDEDDQDDEEREDEEREESSAVQPETPAFGPSGPAPVQPPQDQGDDDDDRPPALPEQPQDGGVQPSAPLQQPQGEDDRDEDDEPPALPFPQPRGDEDDEDRDDDPPPLAPQGQPPQDNGQPPQDQPPQDNGQPPEGDGQQPPQGGGQPSGEPVGAVRGQEQQAGSMADMARYGAGESTFGMPQAAPDGFPEARGAESAPPLP